MIIDVPVTGTHERKSGAIYLILYTKLNLIMIELTICFIFRDFGYDKMSDIYDIIIFKDRTKCLVAQMMGNTSDKFARICLMCDRYFKTGFNYTLHSTFNFVSK